MEKVTLTQDYYYSHKTTEIERPANIEELEGKVAPIVLFGESTMPIENATMRR